MKLSNNEDSLPRDKVIKLAQLIGQNPTFKQMNDAFEACELSDKAELTLDECYAVIWSVWYEIDVDAELREAFSKFDKDRNGFLDKNEFKTAMLSFGETLTEDELNEMLSLVDTNHDGKIDYEGKNKINL